MAQASSSLSLAAESTSIQPASEFVRRGALEAGLPASRLPELDLVMEEILINVARYAYPPEVAGLVEITYAVPQPGRLSIEIADRGAAFNPLAHPEPELHLELAKRPVGGLGVFLTRKLTDSLQYRREGGWNRVCFEILARSPARALD